MKSLNDGFHRLALTLGCRQHRPHYQLDHSYFLNSEKT
jgi:hypothetical protein